MRRFDHVKRRVSNEPVRNSELKVEGTKRGRGRQKITLVKVIKKDMSIREVIESMTSDRIEWRKRIHVTDPMIIEDP